MRVISYILYQSLWLYWPAACSFPGGQHTHVQSWGGAPVSTADLWLTEGRDSTFPLSGAARFGAARFGAARFGYIGVSTYVSTAKSWAVPKISVLSRSYFRYSSIGAPSVLKGARAFNFWFNKLSVGVRTYYHHRGAIENNKAKNKSKKRIKRKRDVRSYHGVSLSLQRRHLRQKWIKTQKNSEKSRLKTENHEREFSPYRTAYERQ